MDDRLQHLTILGKAGDADEGSFLSRLQHMAATNASDVYHLCQWMAGHGRADDALKWFTNCPAKIRAEQLLLSARWIAWWRKKIGSASRNFFKRKNGVTAYLSRTAEEQKETIGVQARWRAAIRSAEDKIGPLSMLA